MAGFGEIALILAGGWILFVSNAGEWERAILNSGGASGIRMARILFAVSLPMIGLSHFFYTAATVALVPAWLPDRIAWAYLQEWAILSPAPQFYCVIPRLAAATEAAMLGIITLLVWGPGLVSERPIGYR